nr:chemokine XC receptor 1 [Misgurnus anguillicaudatus]
MMGEENQNFSYDYDMNYTYYTLDDHFVTLEEHLPFASVINAVCYSIIICISLPGNSFLLWALLMHEGLKSSADLFLLHLTASDIIFTFTLVPWTVNHICGWIFSEMFCKLSNLGIFLGLYSYMSFLTVMTVHRYIVIVHPVFATSVRNSFRITHISSVLVWLISAGFSLPEAFFSGTVNVPDGVFCASHYDSMFSELFGYFTQIIFFFTLPFLVIAFCYGRIGFTIYKSRITSRNRRNAACSIFTIVMGFFVCWTPYNIFLFLYALKILGVHGLQGSGLEKVFEIVYCITHILAYSHCCLNPLIHILGGNKFRRYLPWSRCCTWSSQRYRRYTYTSQSSYSGQTHL